MAKSYIVIQHVEQDDRIALTLRAYSENTDVMGSTPITLLVRRDDRSRSISERDIIIQDNDVVYWEPVDRNNRKLLSSKIKLEKYVEVPKKSV